MKNLDVVTILKESCCNGEPLHTFTIVEYLKSKKKTLNTWIQEGLGEAIQSCLIRQRSIRKNLNEVEMNNANCYLKIISHFLKESKESGKEKKKRRHDKDILDEWVATNMKLVCDYFLFCYRKKMDNLYVVFKSILDGLFRNGSKRTLKRTVKRSFWNILRWNLESRCIIPFDFLLIPAFCLIKKLPKKSEKYLLTPLVLFNMRYYISSDPKRNKSAYLPLDMKAQLKSLYNGCKLKKIYHKYSQVPDEIASACKGLFGKEPKINLEKIANFIHCNMITQRDIIENMLWETLLKFLCKRVVFLDRTERNLKFFLEVFIVKKNYDGTGNIYDPTLFHSLVKLVINSLAIWNDKINKYLFVDECDKQFDYRCDHHDILRKMSTYLTLLRHLYFLNINWYQWFDEPIHPELIDSKAFKICRDPQLREDRHGLRSYRTMAIAFPPIYSLPFRFKLLTSNRAIRLTRNHSCKVSRKTLLEDLIKACKVNTDLSIYSNITFNDLTEHDEDWARELFGEISKDLQRHDLDLWMGESYKTPDQFHGVSDNNDISYTYSSKGLFLKPAINNNNRHFCLLLAVVLKNVWNEGHIFDFPFSPAFYQHISCHEQFRKSYYDLHYVLPFDKRFNEKLIAMKKAKNLIESNNALTMYEKTEMIQKLKFDEETTLDDLCINFTVPGLPDLELREKGKQTFVSPSNIDSYLNELRSKIFGSHKQNLDYLKRVLYQHTLGFCDFRTGGCLGMFFVEELQRHMTREPFEIWTVDALKSYCKLRNGYTLESDAVNFLLEVMVSLNTDERQLFSKFFFGKHFLPPGGLKNLHPLFTITFDPRDEPNKYLPSGNTCENQIFLPNYSSLEITRERIITVMSESATLIAQFW